MFSCTHSLKLNSFSFTREPILQNEPIRILYPIHQLLTHAAPPITAVLFACGGTDPRTEPARTPILCLHLALRLYVFALSTSANTGAHTPTEARQACLSGEGRGYLRLRRNSRHNRQLRRYFLRVVEPIQELYTIFFLLQIRLD